MQTITNDSPTRTLTDQEWLDLCAEPFLDDHQILYWNWNRLTRKPDGFTVFIGSREITVNLTNRSHSNRTVKHA